MRLIASDLDGTLLVSHNEIGNKNLEALKYAKSKGVTFVASSGRTVNSIKEIFSRKNFDPDFIISSNGTMIFSNDGQVLKKTPLKRESAIEVLKYLEENNYCYCITSYDTMYCLKTSYKRIKDEYENACDYGDNRITGALSDFYNLFQKKNGIDLIDSYEDILSSEEDIYCISCISIDRNRLLEGSTYLEKISGINITASARNNFEIYDEKASKGAALEYISSYLNISLNETMALGDNYNDISMLETAKISVAMGNADDEIKKRCSFVTLNNTENGVAYAIYRYL